MSSREGSPPSQAEAAVMRAGMNPAETSEGGPTASGANLPGAGALGSRRPRVCQEEQRACRAGEGDEGSHRTQEGVQPDQELEQWLQPEL